MNRRSLGTQALVASIVTLAVIGLGACGRVMGERVNESLTKEAAQRQIVDYLKESLATLPEGVTFTRDHPVSRNGDFGPGTTVPCDDTDSAATGPVDFSVNYWVSGIPNGLVEDYLDSLVDFWNERGWSTTQRTDGNIRSANGSVPGDYVLVVSTSIRGDLSIGGRSPCFPRPKGPSVGNAPEVIEHP